MLPLKSHPFWIMFFYFICLYPKNIKTFMKNSWIKPENLLLSKNIRNTWEKLNSIIKSLELFLKIIKILKLKIGPLLVTGRRGVYGYTLYCPARGGGTVAGIDVTFVSYFHRINRIFYFVLQFTKSYEFRHTNKIWNHFKCSHVCKRK